MLIIKALSHSKSFSKKQKNHRDTYVNAKLLNALSARVPSLMTRLKICVSSVQMEIIEKKQTYSS